MHSYHMDQLFAPWRIEWVERDAPADADGCPFCRLPTIGDDQEALIVARSEHAYLLLNNFPYNPGHAMVIPFRHETHHQDLSDAELLDCERLVQRTLTAMETAMNPNGFNTGRNLGSAGGGSIGHLHTHVVPRWHGDTNFMAVIDDTKVIVQAVAETYESLHTAFGEQPGAGHTSSGAIQVSVD